MLRRFPGDLVLGRRRDARAPLDRALEAARALKPGSWASVEALSLLSIETEGPAGAELYHAALDASAGLSEGTWESVRALACLARAGRELR